MQETQSKEDIRDHFYAPLATFIESASHQYSCHKLADEQWIQAGVERVLGGQKSGCGFLQEGLIEGVIDAKKSHYFESLKSKRRLTHLKEIVLNFNQSHALEALKQSPSAGLHPSLKDLHIYAGDGHFHAASSHEERDEKGKKHAIGHLYALNLRSQMLSHLKLTSEAGVKKAHDMAVLKKLDAATLRQGANKGQRVLYVWDRAGIDFVQWDKWKYTNGIYFLSREKENMKLTKMGNHGYDREDSINSGVIADELVGNSAGRTLRRVLFISPETGETLSFITTLGAAIPPGVIAQLYFMRWRIEKSFDELKSKLGEQKAWAKSTIAKEMQANFNTLAYNLSVKLEQEIERDLEIRDEKNVRKRLRRQREMKAYQKTKDRVMPSLRESDKKASQRSVKFYRWLRINLRKSSCWIVAVGQLALIYERF